MVRFKNRWLLFEILFEHTVPLSSRLPSNIDQPTELASVDAAVLSSVIREAVRENFGEWGMGCVMVSLNVKYFSPFTNIGIIRISRDHCHLLWATLTFIKELRGWPCILRCIHLSGTVLKAQKFAIQYDREQILRLRNEATIKFDTEKVLEESRTTILAIE